MERSFDIKEYFNIISRRKWYFIIPMVLVVSVSAVFTLTLPKLYYCQATIAIRTRGVNPIRGIFRPRGLNDSRFQMMRSIAKSRAKTEEVIKKLGLEQTVDGPEGYESLVATILHGVVINRSGHNINVSFRGTEPRMLMQVVNTICGFFVEQDINVMFGGGGISSIPVLHDLLDYYERRVNAARGVLAKFKMEHKGQLSSSQNASFAAIERTQLKIAETEVTIKEETEKKRLLEEQLSGAGDKMQELEFVQEKLSPTEQQLNRLYAERDAKLLQYTERHPEIIRVNNKIETLKRKILSSYRTEEGDPYAEEALNFQQIVISPQYLKLRKILDEINQNIQNLQNKKVELAEKIQQLNENVRMAPRNQQEHAALMRDLNVNNKIYKTLQQKIEKAQLAKEIDSMDQSSRFAILSPAKLPVYPVAPNLSKNLIVATVIGILIGTSIALWAELTDHSIRDLADAKQFLNIPILSTIPTVGTEEEIIRKRRVNMLITVVGTFYVIFIMMLITRELIMTYAPSLLYLQTYKEWLYRTAEVLR